MTGITLQPYRGRVRVTALGEVIADTTDALALHERGYEPVLYFPVNHVRFDRLKKTARQTLCPHKGIASYWSIAANGKEIENAVWAYEEPISTVAAIAGRVAFYADKVDAIEALT
jgi:uncharacterized protein (DUF427 family)